MEVFQAASWYHSRMLTTLILAAAVMGSQSPTVLPFGSQVALPDGSTASYKVDVANTNSWGPWQDSTNGWFPACANSWVQFVPIGDMGWLGCTIYVDAKGVRQWARHNDPNYPLGSVWKKPDGTFRPGKVRVWTGAGKPMGSWYNEVWPPENALKVTTNGSDVTAEVNGSPSRCVFLKGNGNDLTVFARQGEQSNNQIDFSTVYVEGDNNTVSGAGEGFQCVVFFNGKNNRLVNFKAKGGKRGDDNGVVYARRGSNGLVVEDTVVEQDAREWPASHMTTGIYIDDETGFARIAPSVIVKGGFMYGAFFHGGSYNRAALVSIGAGTPVKFAPHFTWPAGTLPVANRDLSKAG